MLDSSDLDHAVRRGLVTADQADGLRAFVAARRATPAADEERFGLVDGLSDVMAGAGLFIVLGASLVVLGSINPATTIIVAGAAWLLAEYFTRRRRLTLSSFVLFGMFAAAWVSTALAVALLLPGPGISPVRGSPVLTQLPPLKGLMVASAAVLGSSLWFVRFRLPIAYAAAVLAAINVLVHVARLVAPATPAGAVSAILLVEGLIVFAIAMWWDMSDIRRETRRADIAFWLHAIAGYQVARTAFRILIGSPFQAVGWERLYDFSTLPPEQVPALPVLALFLLFCLVALAIDRRSLLISSLTFLLPTLAMLSGFGGSGGIVVGLVCIGGLLLFLSVFWSDLRRRVMTVLPIAVRAQLPRTQIAPQGSRPVR